MLAIARRNEALWEKSMISSWPRSVVNSPIVFPTNMFSCFWTKVTPLCVFIVQSKQSYKFIECFVTLCHDSSWRPGGFACWKNGGAYGRCSTFGQAEKLESLAGLVKFDDNCCLAQAIELTTDFAAWLPCLVPGCSKWLNRAPIQRKGAIIFRLISLQRTKRSSFHLHDFLRPSNF